MLARFLAVILHTPTVTATAKSDADVTVQIGDEITLIGPPKVLLAVAEGIRDSVHMIELEHRLGAES